MPVYTKLEKKITVLGAAIFVAAVVALSLVGSPCDDLGNSSAVKACDLMEENVR